MVLWQMHSVTEEEQLPLNTGYSASWRPTPSGTMVGNTVGESGGGQTVSVLVVSSPGSVWVMAEHGTELVLAELLTTSHHAISRKISVCF